jgi:hypothetical protein
MTFLQPSERAACAAVCRRWKPVANSPAAWKGWTFRYTTYADLQRIPSPHRAVLRRVVYVQDGNRPAGDPAVLSDLRRVLRELTGLQYIACPRMDFLRIFLEAQAGGLSDARPILGLHIERDLLTRPDDSALFLHPRLSGLEVLQLHEHFGLSDELARTIETTFPRLREIVVRRMGYGEFQAMLQRRPSITSLTVHTVDQLTLIYSLTFL